MIFLLDAPPGTREWQKITSVHHETHFPHSCNSHRHTPVLHLVGIYIILSDCCLQVTDDQYMNNWCCLKHPQSGCPGKAAALILGVAYHHLITLGDYRYLQEPPPVPHEQRTCRHRTADGLAEGVTAGCTDGRPGIAHTAEDISNLNLITMR